MADGIVFYVVGEAFPGMGGIRDNRLYRVHLSDIGETSIEVIIDSFEGQRDTGHVAGIDGSHAAVYGAGGLEYVARSADGTWATSLIDPVLEGNRMDTLTEPTRVLVSGQNVAQYTLTDGAWGKELFEPVANPAPATGCRVGAADGLADAWLLAGGLLLLLRRRYSAVSAHPQA